jgi:hypothetical protein
LAAPQGQEFSASHRGCTPLVQVYSLVLSAWGGGGAGRCWRGGEGWGNTSINDNNNLFDHLDTVYCDSEIIILLHRNNICFFGGKNIIKIYWINIQD